MHSLDFQRNPFIFGLFFQRVLGFLLSGSVAEEGRKEGRKERRKEGRKNEAGRREGRRKEGSKQGSKQVSEEGRKGGRPRPPPNPLPLFKFKQVTQTKPANQFASDWPAKHLTLKHTTEKGPGQKRLLVIGFLARGRSIYVVFLAGRRCALPRTPSRSFY